MLLDIIAKVHATNNYLSHQAVVKRLQWVRENDGRDWNSNVCWTDEISIEQGEQPSQQGSQGYQARNISPKAYLQPSEVVEIR